ncbi:TetR/AcrR family transcriptional regulator [Hoeflea prorocentri]|uniref:TetR/AcrR family transcriptional regulator n=1 Tax=Hoeflea prorocentri TaxID=1922333 RepID=A0A9X3UFF1_9HYPH|nr:TetR/AcrR family transcriptional regulator [Hoeflea prorocentri]MCY6379550.1 TetR/AcrR family transcriptional regulator [Hoeflea prorocentri]MDA5397350.1 TetR/AcrR family transcriptional regulator [Hoeflea prorocentri]
MARPREFDMDTAVDGAMQIFWRLGYSATNLPELLHAMGLSRGSFYKAFGDKHSAYLAALDHYDRTCIGSAVALLADRSIGDGAERILKLFQQTGCGEGIAPRGCFVCNAMVELGPHDEAVAKRTTAMSNRLQSAIFGALSDMPESKMDDFASRHRKAAIIARLYLGAQAMSKTGDADADWKNLLGELLKDPA